MPPRRITRRRIDTDGACKDNGTRYARAGIGVYWGRNDSRNISMPLKGRQTNQRAEIQAVVVALEQALDSGLKYVDIHTDSIYVIKGMTEWIDNWLDNGFRRADGGPVKNRDDFMELYDLCGQINVAFTHIRGHTGDFRNEMADQLAKEAAGYFDYDGDSDASCDSCDYGYYCGGPDFCRCDCHDYY